MGMRGNGRGAMAPSQIVYATTAARIAEAINSPRAMPNL
jgi:hypothetical protein